MSPEILNLLTDSEFADDLTIPVAVALLQIIKKAAALADEHQQTAARSMILLVGLEVRRQLGDTLREDGDLNLGTPGV
jgi:hypothetical protein